MADKTLGQHWLFDEVTLSRIVELAELDASSTILEIGPGLGTLTKKLLATEANVVAVEFDERLIAELKRTYSSPNFRLVQADIREFDLTSLPKGYIVCANIPYYLTSYILRSLSESHNPPARAILLVQKEVAERVAAEQGNHSILSIAVQIYAETSIHDVVPAKYFSPPPKVDSQLLKLTYYDTPKVKDPERLMSMVKAGFSSPRKKLRSSLSAGLHIEVGEADQLLEKATIDPNRRAQTVTIAEWERLSEVFLEKS
jgi:16S rRNA (adenine1518-N6/adenine1519-N6)-dimethyltransferase